MKRAFDAEMDRIQLTLVGKYATWRKLQQMMGHSGPDGPPMLDEKKVGQRVRLETEIRGLLAPLQELQTSPTQLRVRLRGIGFGPNDIRDFLEEDSNLPDPIYEMAEVEQANVG